VDAAGLRVAGFQGCRLYNGGPYQYSEGQMRRIVRWSRLRARRSGAPHIVLTHAPPAGCHDGADPCHRGFEAFREVIDAWHPAFLVHGHTHAYERTSAIDTLGATTVVNAFPHQVFEISV
jgi:Icc-related predicted phosphoesterase